MTRLRQTSSILCMACDPFGEGLVLTGLSSHHICLLLLDGELFLAPITKQPMVRLDSDKTPLLLDLC